MTDYTYQIQRWEARQRMRKVAAVVIVAAGLLILGIVFGRALVG